MVLSTPAALLGGLACLSQFGAALAATVTYDWNITWVRANPDGAFERPVMGINGQWPLPVVNLTKGDRLVANVRNQLGNQTTSMHWHGLFQNSTNFMDGPQGVTQCGIAPGSSMTYNFTVEQSGTYWYHSHTHGQYPDGLRQILHVNDPENPYKDQFDEEVSITLSDWYHDEMPDLIASFISVSNPTGAEPVPKAALMNDTQNLTVAVQPGRTYLFHLANVGAFAGQYFWIEGHKLKIVEVDGVFTEAAEADMIYLTAAQRYSFLVTTKNATDSNFAMVGSMDTDLFDDLPEGLQYNVTGWLVYKESAEKPAPATIDAFNPFDDFTLVPTDGEKLLDTVDQSVTLDLSMINLNDGANYAAFNDVTYVAPKVPTLYTALSSGEAANNATIYGSYTNSFVMQHNEVIEIVLNNDDPGKHPFHLHGHNFQVLVRAEENAGFYDPSNHSAFPSIPMRRDVLMVRPQSNFVIRYRSDNPGVNLFHCHIEWHMQSGLVATFIEAPMEMQKTLTIPADHLQVCKDSGMPTTGNAAGNTADLFDLSGENKSAGPIPAGFTAKGIVAMVFSIISALLGLAVIAWYGAAPIGGAKGVSLQSTIVSRD
ncbi:iron transport multicopper oxidase FET3 [Elsinoe australis]|uniref:Iron transport multicopper oxidase FET3 n=1 Tax=Elsinoe australis TaxID=40998 RepID=A0A4U7B0I2_9PEZI|nr:iron transport multicopper oxidase FET3 [Elsinoe australis]